MREFIMDCALVANSDEELVKYLREIANKIEFGQRMDSMPGVSLPGYAWYVCDFVDYEGEDEDLTKEEK